jgi:tRNA-modifying protein YgfZ
VSTPTADLRTSLRAVPIARDVVRVSGPDAVTYLQGQASQDVGALAVGATSWTFVLQPTGKVDVWARVTRTADDEFLLDTDPGAGEVAVARLRRFLLRTKAEVDAVDGWSAVALRGPGAEAAAREAAASGAAGGTVLAVRAGWPGVEGADLLGPADALAAVALPDGVAPGTAEELAALRLLSGVPAAGTELTEKTIPAETGQWVIGASVSFTKGCFTGQELTARVDSRGGNVPRHLRAVLSDGPFAVGDQVLVDGAPVGTVTSAAPRPGGGTVGLAYVSRSVTPPAEVGVIGPADAATATVVATPVTEG